MQITTLEITDYKRVRKVAITPDADRHVILIGGRNGHGKSSTLDALTAAFGGGKQVAADPVRHGAAHASIYVELDGGALTIDRTVTPDGKTKVEVRDRDGAVRQPQAMLDKLIGARFLDPLAFLQLPAKEQRAQLMKIIPGAERIADLNAKRERAFTRRTEIGRDLKAAEGELARLPEVEPGAPIDVAALVAERAELVKAQAAAHSMELSIATNLAAIEAAEARVKSADADLARLREQLAATEQRREQLMSEVAALKEDQDDGRRKLEASAEQWRASAPRRAQVDVELARAGEHNRAIGAAEAQLQRRQEATAAIAKLKADSEELTAGLAKIEARKAEILAAAKLPVDGLTITDDGIELAGVPFEQGSDAERWRVALALAIAGSPGLNDVWVRDGALLDDESLELVAKHAAAAGKRVWIERVGTRDPGAIVIQDGQVIA